MTVLISRNLMIVTAACSALVLVGPDAAMAGSFAVHERSTEAQGASFAGADSGGGDITFAGFNPAALGNVENFEIGTNLSLIVFEVQGETFNAFTDETSRNDVADPALVPALALGYRVHEDFVVGLTINSQFGLLTEYPNNALEWPAAGAALESGLSTITVTPLVAWQPAPGLTIAAGPSVVYADSTLSRAIGAPGTMGSAFPEFPISKLEGDTFEFGWQIGATLKPWQGTTIGVSYTSGYTIDIDGEIQSPAGTFDASARASLPAVFGLGLRQSLGEGITLMANARYFNWSSFSEIAIQLPIGFPDATEITNYDDGFFVGLGLEADVGGGVTLRGGVAYDDTPTTTEFLSPRIPDADRYWISLGASYRWNDKVKLDAAYSLILPNDTTIGANGTTIFAPIDYSGQLHIFSLGASLSF